MLYQLRIHSHWWCNDQHARLECDRPWVRTKDYKIGICCLSTKYTVLRSKQRLEGKECSSGATCPPGRGLLCQSYHYKNATKRICLVQSGHHDNDD